jgi:hypothetical protein
MSDTRPVLVEDYAPVDITDLRRAVGGRTKLRALENVTLNLQGTEVVVRLARRPSNIPGGMIIEMICQGCQKVVRVLRIAPTPEVLLCSKCLNRIFRARYASQVRPRLSTRTQTMFAETKQRDEEFELASQ